MFTTNERIKVYRKRLGLSQEEIAAKMGMTHPPYLAREKGRRSWTLTELEKLAEIFGCTVKDLIEDHADQTIK
jgi:transcriptional regulator with XRE-family HTH domain